MRPRWGWFVIALLVVPVASVALLWALGIDLKKSVAGDILSFCSAIAFFFASWRSIETRTALAELQATVRQESPTATVVEKPAVPPMKGAGDTDLLLEGKAIIDGELQNELIDHIRLEWWAYLIGFALLLTVLLLSLVGSFSG